MGGGQPRSTSGECDARDSVNSRVPWPTSLGTATERVPPFREAAVQAAAGSIIPMHEGWPGGSSR